MRGRLLERMLGPQAIADVGVAALEVDVSADELLVDPAGLDDVVGDVVEDHEIGLRGEHHRDVGELEIAVLEGREHGHLDVRRGQAAVGHPGPEDRVHLRHVGAPQHERVGRLDVVVAAHRLVHAEGAHEARDRGRHAVPGVGVEVVGAEARLHQLDRGVALPDGPLAGAEHADRARPLVAQGRLELLRHDVERLVPGHGRELAVLVEAAVGHAQQRRGQAVLAVHDLGQEVALDAVQAAVDLGLDVAMGRDHAAGLGRHHDAAAGAAEAAGRLRPGERGLPGLGDQVGGPARQIDAGDRRSDRRGVGLEVVAARERHDDAPSGSRPSGSA